MKNKPRSSKQANRPTIVDVAQAAHVSVMTVSRVINNYETLRPNTRAKVMAAIAKVGYRPNEAARILKGMPGRTIAFVVPDLTDFFATCFHAIQEVALRHEYKTIVIATGRSSLVESQQIDELQNSRIAGLVIVTSGGDTTGLQALQQEGIPIVALDRPVKDMKAPSVLVENREGAELGVEHLIEHQHKRIACVGFEADVHTVRERIQGYETAMRNAGLEQTVFGDVDSLDETEKLLSRWMGVKDRPTAIFLLQRISSIRMVQALHRQKLRAPKDFALVGFDDFELTEVLRTPLTVIQQLPAEMARRAAELLFEQIQNRRREQTLERQASKIVFPTRLIVRASCGCTGFSNQQR